jgi:hypothetical protein
MMYGLTDVVILDTQVPIHWRMRSTSLAYPPSLTCDEYDLIEVPSYTSEFMSLQADFISTHPFYQSGIMPEYFNVHRIENYKLFCRYYAKKMQFINQRFMNDPNEVMLYHGTPYEANVKAICRFGFDLGKSRPNMRLLGHGVYFSRLSGNSDPYTNSQVGSIKHMFRARVLLGDISMGRSPRCEMLYDSTMDSKCENYCAMDNAQCYPEYLITYC